MAILKADSRVAQTIERALGQAGMTLPLLALTDDGWAALERSARLVFTAEQRLLCDYTADELRTLTGLLSRLVTPAG